MDKKDKKGVWKHIIEDIIEERNGLIQVCYFCLLLIFCGVYALGKESYYMITIQLLMLITLELLNLNIKDSISHRKLNKISKYIEMDVGALIRVSDFELHPFLSIQKTIYLFLELRLVIFFKILKKKFCN